VIIDTSAWIEFSRTAEGPTTRAVQQAIRDGSATVVDIVRLELLVGLSRPSARVTSRLLATCRFVPQEPIFDVDDAVDLFERCRRAGETIRSPNDCLIAAIALRIGVPVLHVDRDFDAMARHSALQATRG
jgi:predicted nucleic acid-binding protein